MSRRIALALMLLVVPAIAQEEEPGKTRTEASLDEAAKLITVKELEKKLEVIASDEMEGRNAGYPGEEKATEYIAGEFKKIGLKAVGDKDEDGNPTYFQHFEFAARGSRTKKRKARNCVGLAEGSDEKLKEEIVVIGAHHDHVGKTGQANPGRMGGRGGDPDDDIWNGADDNGSGTVLVMEIARAVMEGKIRTKRSILFMTFTAEEHGLLGSAHYCANMIFPRKNHVAMVNLDMVGRNPGRAVSVSGTGTSSAWEDLIEAAADASELDVHTSSGVSGGSDHASFAAKRIPAVHFFTGFHGDYHKKTDHTDEIAFGHMAKIGRCALRLIVALADLPERPKFSGSTRRLLGISGDDITDEEADDLGLDEDQGGIKINRVSRDSAGEAAGLKSGDVLLSLNGQKIPRERGLTALRRAIRKAPANKKVPLAVLRDGGKIELQVIWEE